MIQIHFHNTENQMRWAWTDGFKTLGQQEIAVKLSWPEHDLRDKLIIQLLRFVEDYLISQPERIFPEQTLHYGWVLLRFVCDEHNLSGTGTDTLLIEEMLHPFSHDDSSYISGVDQTIALTQLQHEAMRRNRVTGDVVYPHRSQHAIICKRITPSTIHLLRPLRAHRASQLDTRDSGWFIGCCDHNHNHDDPDELASVHLFHLVELFPAFFPYIAMPVDTMLLFEENRVIIFHPGEKDGQIDVGKLLYSLPF